MLVLLIYVDDIVINGSIMEDIFAIQNLLYSTFHIKDLGHLTYFLGLEVHHWPQGIFLNQNKYIQNMVWLVRLTNITSIDTPLELNIEFHHYENELFQDIIFYWKLVRSIIYLTNTRPNISYVVHTVSKFIQAHRDLYLSVVHRIIQHLPSTPSHD